MAGARDDASSGEIPDAVLEELFAVAPDEFVARRTAISRGLRADGDRATAAAVAALRRPSAAAWIVNQLAADRRRTAPVRELAEEVAGAMAGGDAARLRELAAAQRILVTDLTEHGSRLLDEATGRGATAAVREQVADALRRVATDSAAGEELLTGRLVEIPVPDDALTGGLLLAVPQRTPAAARTAARVSGPPRGPAGPRTTGTGRAARADAEAERRARRRREATRVAAAAEQHQERAAAELDRVRERLTALREELVGAEAELQRAEREHRDAELAARRARRALAALQR